MTMTAETQRNQTKYDCNLRDEATSQGLYHTTVQARTRIMGSHCWIFVSHLHWREKHEPFEPNTLLFGDPSRIALMSLDASLLKILHQNVIV